MMTVLHLERQTEHRPEMQSWLGSLLWRSTVLRCGLGSVHSSGGARS
jgi:hypothetical protein